MKGPVDIGDLSPRHYFFTVAVALGLIFAFIDDSVERSLLSNLLIWQLQSCIPMALLLVAHLQLSRFARFERLGPWQRLGISGAFGALLFAPLALLLDIHLFGDDSEVFSLQELAEELFHLAPPVILTWVGINAPFVLGFRLRAAPSSTTVPQQCEDTAQAVTPKPGPRGFMALVPGERRNTLLYLQAELHYLAVVTESGRSLILYNLRDAISELGSTAGLQTHRSFWVAREAIESYHRDGRQGRLLMRNGDTVPVSRRRMPAVEHALGEQHGA